MGQGEEERKNALEKRTLVANGFRLDDAIRYCVHQVFLEAVMRYSVCIYPSSLIIQRCISAMTTPPYEFATRPKKTNSLGLALLPEFRHPSSCFPFPEAIRTTLL